MTYRLHSLGRDSLKRVYASLLVAGKVYMVLHPPTCVCMYVNLITIKKLSKSDHFRFLDFWVVQTSKAAAAAGPFEQPIQETPIAIACKPLPAKIICGKPRRSGEDASHRSPRSLPTGVR